MAAANPLTSSDNAAAMDDRRLMELLIMMVVIHSLLRKEGADDDGQLDQMKDMVKELSMSINGGGDQPAVSSELLVITQRLLDAQLRLQDGGENESQVEVSSSALSDHQLMDNAAAAKKEEKAAAAKKKKKKRNKAAAKHKGTKRMSWLGGGIISLLMIMAAALGSITSLSHIPQSDESSEGKAPPTLPPSASTSLRQRDLQQSSNNMAPSSPASVSPFSAVVQAPVPVFLPADVSNPPMNSVDERALSTCFDTPNWKDLYGDGCQYYEKNDEPGCPHFGSTFDGGMGVANDNCCYCEGGILTPSSSPKPSSSPTKSVTPSSSPSPSSAPSMCTDTEGWYDEYGYDCSWYEVMDVPGCPQYGDLWSEYTSTGVAKDNVANDNCCYCKNDVVNTVSPTKAPSSSGTCVDTEGWDDERVVGCDLYPRLDDPGCPRWGNDTVGEMGSAADNCCYCKVPTCEDFNRRCQVYARNDHLDNEYYTNWTTSNASRVCDKAASCSCKAADHFKIVTNPYHRFNFTVGLFNECKCDFWFRLCEDTREGVPCDYAAEYCCGDYVYYEELETFNFLNSPLCYCDFFNYAQNELGHTLKPKALNISKEFSNPCGQDGWYSSTWDEKESLEAMYNETNGQNWKNNDGWRDERRAHCQWYGISCDDEGHVTSIDLRDNNLVGQFPVYSRRVAGLANLFKLKTLDLANNKLTGTIVYLPLYNLNALTHFDVSGNQLSGEVDALVAPSLTHADFSNNNFTTMRRFEKYKVSPLQTLRYCDVSNNAIQEDATDLLENIPSNIEQFIASNNNISGVLPESLNNLQKLRQFKMASNALSGKLPGFTESFVTLQELDMSNQTNSFTGSIPENVWRSLSLKILNLAGNRLTGTIPLLVGNLAVLEIFDVSNNLLDSSVPAELGMLEGSLKRLGLSNNTFTGIIPSQIGQLQGASVFLKENRFHNTSTAPLSLCLEREVKEFDLENDTILCPPERNALSDFYDSAKGAEWTDQGNKIDGTQWLDEYASYCDWNGVTCDDDKSHVTKLQLSNNGLSGRLSEKIGNLSFIEVLDLSDNDIKGSIPVELALLSNLTYLRLSYNAFTGAAPEGLGEMKGLHLLQLQSNRITEMPIIPRLDNSIHGQSTFVTDCGVPSAFDEALECENCTMCCNANEDCHPQEETQVAPLNYGKFAAVLFACFFIVCCMLVLVLYTIDRYRKRGNALTPAMEQKRRDEEYALSKIGKNSVYSYFVTNSIFGWLAAVATVVIQVGILAFFIIASEANLQDDIIDIQFAWKCPRDTDVCENKSDLNEYGWAIFSVLMTAFLAKDVISGSKLIYHSSKIRHSLISRIRYFFGGMILCSVTLFALYVSTVYNKAIATSNTELIVNSVIVLFVMELDEWIFSDLKAINEKWTAHAEDGTIDEMKAQIASQQEEIRVLRDSVQKIQETQGKGEQIASQQEEEVRKLRELVQTILESQAAAATTSDSENVSEFVGDTNARQMEQVDDNNAQ